MKKKIATLISVLALGASISACGATDGRKYETDCHEAGGRVVHVAEQYTCIKDGVKVAEWEIYE